MNFLYKDGLHLLDSGKELLVRYFDFSINNFTRSIQTPKLEGTILNKKNEELYEIENF